MMATRGSDGITKVGKDFVDCVTGKTMDSITFDGFKFEFTFAIDSASMRKVAENLLKGR